MDKTYILEQGILELYVLGELNKSEQQQVEDAIRQYPELKIELETIEAKFETIAFEHAIQAPDIVKRNLMNEVSHDKSKTIPLQTQNNSKNYLAFAASIAALLLVGSIYFYSELNTTKQQLQLVNDQNKEAPVDTFYFLLIFRFLDVINLYEDQH